MSLYAVSKRSLTLIELLIVVLLTGVLLTIAVPGFINIKLKTEDSQARSNLKIIQTAVKDFNIDHGHYGKASPGDGDTCNTTQECNGLYSLDLAHGKWNYWVSVSDPAVLEGHFCVNADKVADDTESWHIWEYNTTAQDCRCAGDRCTGR